MRSRLLLAISSLFFFAPATLMAAPKIDFKKQIWPLLQAKCVECHGPETQEGQLRLDARVSVFRGGVSGRLFTPGEGEQSLLMERILGDGDMDRMPADDDPLSDEQVDLIRAWITQGAQWPPELGVKLELKTHWAYAPPRRAELPQVDSPWPRTPIDYYVYEKMTVAGMKPSPRAEPARLIRRVYLDLIGLPPTVEEVLAFEQDSSDAAFERIVDRLLKSPHYGERWARPWLDLARYADSNGYQADQYRNVWPFRDWVIQAMNDDMPFDQFTVEQLAGDLLPDATLQQKIATGFNRLTTCNVEAGVDPEDNRIEQVIDRVNTTGTVWLGTTLECARCHNHKYDPFSQREYYGLFAFFNNTPLEVQGNGVTYNFYGPKMPLPLEPDKQAQLDKLKSQRATIQREWDAVLASAKARLPAWEQRVKDQAGKQGEWTVLEPTEFTSAGGAAHKILDDQSILVSGDKPLLDVYTVRGRLELSAVNAVRLETLTDKSLPGNGPGRHTAESPNFVLQEVTAKVVNGSGETPLVFSGASADFSQRGWDVKGVIDGDPKTGWGINPQFGKPHEAILVLGQPVDFGAQSELVVRLVQNHGAGRTIGRLRLAVHTGRLESGGPPKAIATILDKPAAKRSAEDKQSLLEHLASQDGDAVAIKGRLKKIDASIAAIQPDTTLVMVEMDEPRTTNLMKRGNFKDLGSRIRASTPAALHHSPQGGTDRLAFARWLVRPENPLVGRVTVNRWWAEFFGSGLVATLEDLGSRGDPPTHPRALDWLTAEFVETGWSMKRIHKTIVMSATYQQSAQSSESALRKDPYNRLYARGPRHRLSAEMIRDNALRICGLLSEKMGGPPVFPPQPPNVWRHVGRNAPKYITSQGSDRFRRGIYVFWRRSAPYAAFVNFDAPDRSSCVVARPRTNTPLQALTLMNDPAYLEMALALARRIIADRPEAKFDERVEYAFRRCVARAPRDVETQRLREFYTREIELLRSSPERVKLLLDKATPADADEARELAVWYLMSNILLNLDEVITKG
ncbi:MAG: DUF1553 domain-containing protein [Pirellulaceae bacterium]|nr:DUF1553 domain-containing protein [Pirellulaceae bacterium]